MSGYYIKRIAVLKQVSPGYSSGGKPLSGIAKVEKSGNSASVRVSLLNISPVSEGEYLAGVIGANGEMFSASLGRTLPGDEFFLNGVPDIERGLAALVAYIRDGKVVPVAFGISGNINYGVDDLKTKFIPQREQTLPRAEVKTPIEATAIETPIAIPVETPSSADSQAPVGASLPDYQDEVVAAENYYQSENNPYKGINPQGEENYILSKEVLDYGECEKRDVRYEAYRTEGCVLKENEKTEFPFFVEKNEDAVYVSPGNSILNELNEETSKENLSELFKENEAETDGPYYDKVKEELEKLLKTYPKEVTLCKNIPDSDWVKIEYGGNKHYAVGIIYQGSEPAYICYGVPGKATLSPPEELKGFCSYLPGANGNGYWMMYQDAKTGECAEVNYI